MNLRMAARYIWNGITEPARGRGYLRHIGTAINSAIYKRYHSRTKGKKITKKDWDTLLILDGCRYDIFHDQVTLDGTLSKRVAHGSTSYEFLERNFDENHHDTVYVSANPYTSRLSEGMFYKHIPLYETSWDEDLQTVTPSAMTDAVREAHRNYPNKRIIGHYMQPHYPFISERGQSIDHRGYAQDGKWSRFEIGSIWQQLQYGATDATHDEIIQAYRENLELVIAKVETLLPDLTGKVIITADHGNLIGERQYPLPVRAYGHPDNRHNPGLIKVPWFETKHITRREIIAESPDGDEKSDDEAVNELLQALGYRE